jgi:hypothetical protein
MSNKAVLFIAIVGVVFISVVLFTSDNGDGIIAEDVDETDTSLELAEVDSSEYGIAFRYRTQGPDGYTIVVPSDNELDRNQVFLRALFLTKDYEPFIKSFVAREGPTAMTAEAYRNPTGRSVQEWIESDPQSNHPLAVGTSSTVSYGDTEYITYVWDGLYRADTYITEKNGYIYVFTVTYTDSESLMRNDLKDLLTTVEFKEPKIPAQTAHNVIRVNSPRPQSIVASPITIEGEARGPWFFEASFPITLTDWDGRIIAQHYIMTADEWMTEDFVSFQGELEFESPYKVGDPEFMKRGTLILQKDNPSGLPEHDDAIEIPIMFEALTSGE